MLNPMVVLDAYAQVSRPIVMQYMRIRSTCVASTAITIETLRRFDIEAKPRPFRVIISNRARVRLLSEWIQANPMVPVPPLDVQQRWCDDLGAKELACGFGAPPGTPADMRALDGHLVAHVPALDTIVDGAFDQFERPAYNIGPLPGVHMWLLEPHAIGEGFYSMRDDQRNVYRFQDHPTLTPADWECAADWQCTEANQRIASVIVELMRAHMDDSLPFPDA